jgi:hypothetical protein
LIGQFCKEIGLNASGVRAFSFFGMRTMYALLRPSKSICPVWNCWKSLRTIGLTVVQNLR